MGNEKMDMIAEQKNLTIRFIENQDRHDVMYAAAASPDDMVYFALCGETGYDGCFAKLVRYHPATEEFKEVADLEKVIQYSAKDLKMRHPHSKIHTAICFASDGKLLAATHMTAPPIGEDAYHYWQVCNDPDRKYTGSHLIIHDPVAGTTEDFGVAVPGGGARWMTYNPERNEVYITSFLRCHFHSVNLSTGERKDFGRISQHDFLGPCYSPADGCVYTSDSKGNFLRFRPDKGILEQLPIGLPDDFWASRNGRGIFNLLPSRDGKKLYGTTWMTHHIFEYDPLKGRFGTMRDLGILGDETVTPDRFPVNRFFPRMLIVGHDGKLYFGAYNVQGEKRVKPHIFSLDPETLEQEDLGRIEVDGFQGLGIVPSACCTSDNTLYFGGAKAGSAAAISIYRYNRNGVPKEPEQAYFGKYDLAHLPAKEPAYAFLADYHTATPRDNGIFADCGTLIVQEEGMSGAMPLIPRQAGRIGALIQDSVSGVVAGTTHGAVPWFFLYFPQMRYFYPIREFGKAGEECRSMVQMPNGQVFFGTYSADGGRLYQFDLPKNRSFFYQKESTDRGEFTKLYTQPPEKLKSLMDWGEIAPGQGIWRMINEGDKLYGLMRPSGDFFSFDPATGKKRIFPCFKEYIMRSQNLPEVLLAYGNKIWFAGHHGHIIAFDIQTESFAETTMKIPCCAGREYLSSMTAATPCGNGIYYGGTGADGLLFRMDLNAGRILSLGRPGIENRIRALAYNRDGVLWGISGQDDDICHLFRYRLEDGLADKGILRSRMPETWIVHCADVMLPGSKGEIFIGENDDISHLLVFLPEILQQKEVNL